MQNCWRVNWTGPGLRRTADPAAPAARAANLWPVAWACSYWTAWLEWFSDPPGTTGGSVCGSSSEPLSPTRNMAIPGWVASNACSMAPGQSALIPAPALPISWLWAARLMTVKIGTPDGVRAWRTPILGSTAATRSSWGNATEVGNWSEMC
jgi:hypothetical protein